MTDISHLATAAPAAPGGPTPYAPTSAFAFLVRQSDASMPVADPVSSPPSPDTAELDPVAVAARLRSAGHQLLARDGRLFISNASLLTDADRAAIKQVKPALLLLATPVESVPIVTTTSNVSSGSLADFLRLHEPTSTPRWVAQTPPSLEGITDIVLNFETNGLHWANGDKPIGLTVGTLDGRLKRFLPFGFRGGNLDESAVKEFARRELRGKRITNANTRFDVHMSRVWGVDLEEQGCTVSDVQHYAALLDDHRKRFALDVLAQDYLGGIEVPKLDERDMATYDAQDVALRAEYQVQLVAELRNAMWPQLDAQELQDVRQLEDEFIYPLVEMEKNGSKIDVELLDQFSGECIKTHGRLMRELSDEVGFAFEHTTTGWQRLFERCYLTPQDSYAEDVVGTIDHPLIQKAHLAGQYASLNSKTFAAYKKQIDSHGIIRYDINQLRGDEGGTVSGRLSLGYIHQCPNHDNHHSVFGTGDTKTCGGMCDLFPRRLFIPERGMYLEADAAQIEYRLFAHFANNAEVLKAYSDDPRMSFHKKTWEMFKVYKPNMLYTSQKTLNFAKQYGAKLVKLAVMMGFITSVEGEEIRAEKRWNDPRLKEAQEIEGIYKRVMPEGDYLLDRAAHLAKSKCDDYCRQGDKLHREFEHRGHVKTILGRRSRFPNNYKTYIGLNRVLQGSAADIQKRKTIELHNARKQTGFLMRITVHDAVGGDAQAEDTLTKVSEILNRQSFPLKVPILWECGVGSSWAETK